MEPADEFRTHLQQERDLLLDPTRITQAEHEKEIRNLKPLADHLRNLAADFPLKIEKGRISIDPSYLNGSVPELHQCIVVTNGVARYATVPMNLGSPI